MDAKKFVLAFIAATLVTYLLSFAWHGFLMAEQYGAGTAAVARPAAEIGYDLILIGHVVLGLLMAWAFPIGDKGGPAVSEGFRFGAFVGVLWILPWSLIIVGLWQVPLGLTLMDSAWHVVEEGLGGIAVALVYRRAA